MPTIHDVAKRAGVAPITVSRVINKSGYFSEETRERVERAVMELGYVPNLLARSLRSKRTHTIALILTDITNPHFTTCARGVEDAASAAGFTVIFCNTDESESKEARYLKVLLQKQVDGFLLVPAQSKQGAIDLIRQHGEPVVVLDRRVPLADVDIVRCDSVKGACELVGLLTSLGHRRIAVLSGPQGVSTAEDRVDGYRCAMEEAGIAVDERYVFFGEFNRKGGYEMARCALSLDPRPTAFFAANNFITIGAMAAIREAGLEIPKDIALVGFDDLSQSEILYPFLTVAAQPAYEMGFNATQLLIKRLSEHGTGDYEEIILPTQVIVRVSSGKAIA
jgi:LacI family transcriptional regulator